MRAKHQYAALDPSDPKQIATTKCAKKWRKTVPNKNGKIKCARNRKTGLKTAVDVHPLPSKSIRGNLDGLGHRYNEQRFGIAGSQKDVSFPATENINYSISTSHWHRLYLKTEKDEPCGLSTPKTEQKKIKNFPPKL